ncbi:MAG: histidine kinase dimerization/phospho-acceptor domain-containing protein, partial [Acidimicrobiales bacterium]
MVAVVVGLLAALALAVGLAGTQRRRCRELADELARAGRAMATVGEESGQATARAASLTGALEVLALGVVVVDGGGQVLFRNRSAGLLVGSRDALASQAVSDLVMAARHDGPAARTVELFGPPRRTLALSATVVEGRAGTVAVVLEDVSDRKRLDAVRRDFVANVSHELKTPVAALGLLAETLAGEEDRAVVQRLATRMNTEAFRVARIIEDLLDLSRLESEQAPSHERVQVAAVLA